MGFEVTLARETLPQGSTDPRQLAEAVRRGLVLVTRNRTDFELVHETWILAGRGHPGILTAFGQPPDFVMGIQLLFDSMDPAEPRDRLFIWDSPAGTWHIWE
jgi:hypothetical protein